MERKLHKSSTDKALCGVCGGFAEYFGIDSVIIRLLFVLLALGAGSGLLIYIICAIIMPDERKLGEQADYNYAYTDYTGTDSSTEGYYQDRAANNDYTSYSYTEPDYSRKEGKQLNKHQGLGLILIIVAGLILLKYFIPRIPNALMTAGLLLVIGLFLLLRKK